MDACRKVIMQSRLIDLRYRLQCGDGVIRVVAAHLADSSDALERLSNDVMDVMDVPLARADETRKPRAHGTHRHPRDARVIPRSRDSL